MLRIEQMYAFVALDPTDDTEGIIGFQGNGGMMPMVGADMKRIDDLRPYAEATAKASGMKVRLLRFEVRTELEVIEP